MRTPAFELFDTPLRRERGNPPSIGGSFQPGEQFTITPFPRNSFSAARIASTADRLDDKRLVVVSVIVFGGALSAVSAGKFARAFEFAFPNGLRYLTTAESATGDYALSIHLRAPGWSFGPKKRRQLLDVADAGILDLFAGDLFYGTFVDAGAVRDFLIGKPRTADLGYDITVN